MIVRMNYHIERFYKRIGGVILLVCAVIFIALSNRASQSELYHNEYADDDTLPRESITYTVDGMKKEILTSDSGEICVKIPRWEELTTVYMTEDSKEILVHFRWDSAEWFLCEKDSTGTIRAQKGITVFYNDTSEPYFLSYQGNPYLCIVNRDAEGGVENVALYDFATLDYIGTLIYMDASSLRLCSYVRNEGTYGTREPWYLYLGDEIDSGKEYYAILGQWEITEKRQCA